MFIELLCKIPTSPIKKMVWINISSIKCFFPNGSDGSKTFIYLDNDLYYVADDDVNTVYKKIKEAENA